MVTRFAVTGVPAGGTIAGKATLGPPLPAADIRSSGSISGVAAMPGGEIWTVGSQNGALNNDNRYSHADLRLFQTLAFPQNTSAPQISGSAVRGQTVTCSDGSFTDTPTFTRQWLRAGQPIAAATATAYTLTAADVGRQITCRVTATGTNASTSADSAAIVPVDPAQAGAPGSQGPAGPAGPRGSRGPRGPRGRTARVTCRFLANRRTVRCRVRYARTTGTRTRLVRRGRTVARGTLSRSGTVTLRRSGRGRLRAGRYIVVVGGVRLPVRL